MSSVVTCTSTVGEKSGDGTRRGRTRNLARQSCSVLRPHRGTAYGYCNAGNRHRRLRVSVPTLTTCIHPAVNNQGRRFVCPAILPLLPRVGANERRAISKWDSAPPKIPDVIGAHKQTLTSWTWLINTAPFVRCNSHLSLAEHPESGAARELWVLGHGFEPAGC